MTKEELEAIKDLIIWAKAQNIAVLTVKDVSVTFFSSLKPADISGLVEQDQDKQKAKEDYDKELYWSSER